MTLCWTASGVLPPIALNEHPTGRDRSPYLLSMPEAIDYFVTTKPRLVLFRGLLRYRRAMHDVGICNGFQWINGSFVEQVEVMKNRPPNDIDVVTFAHLPQGCASQKDLITQNPDLFTSETARVSFSVDGYLVFLDELSADKIISQATYWYSMWSKQRESFAWKGFIQISLSPDQDLPSGDILITKEQEFDHA